MQIFIKFLIYSLRTADGMRGSAEPFLKFVIDKQCEKIEQVTHKKVSAGELAKLKSLQENILYEKITKKYFILRVRLKISFMAALQGKTVPELFYHTILKSYDHF